MLLIRCGDKAEGSRATASLEAQQLRGCQCCGLDAVRAEGWIIQRRSWFGFMYMLNF